MYSLVSTIAKKKDNGFKWVSVDITLMSFKVLFSTYTDVYSTLFSEVLNTSIIFDVNSLKNEYNQSDNTLVDFLNFNGNNTLEGTSNYPTLHNGLVKYANGFHAGYTITPTYKANSNSSTLPDSWKTWLRLNKNNVTPLEFHKYCMVSVNGYFHLIDHDDNYVYVIDGNVGRKICNDNKLGVYSFYDIGKLTYIPITTSMISKANKNIPLFSKTIIRTTESLANKTPILVLGGYMIALDENIYTVISDNEIMINFNDFQLLEKYYESLNYLNLDSLGLTVYKKNESLVDFNEFYSDATITNYLTLSQSFIVLVDNPAMYVDRVKIEKESYSKAYRTTLVPQYPLMLGFGRVSEYWYHKNEIHYYITVQNNAKQNFLFRTADPLEEISAVDSRYPYKIAGLSDGYFLKIGSTIKGNI